MKIFSEKSVDNRLLVIINRVKHRLCETKNNQHRFLWNIDSLTQKITNINVH